MLSQRYVIGQDQSDNTSIHQVGAGALTLEMYLLEICPKLGLQFTEEIANPPKSQAFLDFWAQAPINWKDRETFFTFLKSIEKSSGFVFKIDQKHPKVIHVIDSQLIGLEHYAIEQTVDFEYAGTLGMHFMRALHNEVDHLEPRMGGDWRRSFDDNMTPIAIAIKKQQVRQLLTDAVPLKCYESRLWRAVTELDKKLPVSTVQYFGLAGFDDGGKNWPWWEWLRKHGKEYGCQFTIEFAYRSPDNPGVCPAFFSDDETFESREALLAELQKRVPYLTAVKDTKRPGIIHLIDRELLNLKGYRLEQPVTIDYVGNPDRLVSAIALKVPTIDAESLLANFGDRQSKITVHAQDEPLRNVLANCVPLETESGVFWQARTWIRKDKPVTMIAYASLGLPTTKTILRSNVEVDAQWLRENTGKSEAEIAEYSRRERALIERYILEFENTGKILPE